MAKINIIYKEPHKLPKVRKIDNELGVFQSMVQGYIEIVRVLPGVACVCNEDGKLNGMAPNFWFGGDNICGPVFFAGLHVTEDGEDFCSLPPEVLGTIYAELSSWGEDA